MRLMDRLKKRKTLLKKSASYGFIKPDDWGPAEDKGKVKSKVKDTEQETPVEAKKEVEATIVEEEEKAAKKTNKAKADDQ